MKKLRSSLRHSTGCSRQTVLKKHLRLPGHYTVAAVFGATNHLYNDSIQAGVVSGIFFGNALR